MPCRMNEQTKILNCKLYDASGRASGIFLVLMMRFGAALGLAPWRHLSRNRLNPSLREPGGVAQRLENTSDDDFPSTSIIHDIISSLFPSSSSFSSNPIPLCFFATGFLNIFAGLTMSSQRYERVRLPLHLHLEPSCRRFSLDTSSVPLWNNRTDSMAVQINVHDDEDNDTPITPTPHNTIPSSPPPSFRSRTSSPSSRHLLSQDPLASEAEQTLADTFDDGDSDGEDDTDDRQRLMRGQPDSPVQEQAAQSNENGPRHPIIQRRVTELPAFAPPVTGSGRVIGGGRSTNDGVFANMAAKPERGEKGEDHPPVSFC
jgi:hypothetical protein